jgi:hypothetical protein
MSLYEYDLAQRIEREANWGEDFYALVMVLMRHADTLNQRHLRAAWPHVWDELEARYNAPRGLLPGETDPEGWSRDAAGNLYDPDEAMARPSDGA